MSDPAETMARHARLASVAGSPVPSPCVSVCRMDERSGLCEGCLRTIDEIMAWGALQEPAKRAVWRLIAQRAESALAAQRALERKAGS